VGAMACFVVSALSYIPFIGVAVWILPRRAPAPPRADAPARSNVLGGIRTVLSDVQVRSALLSVLATGVLCGPLITFTPVLVKNVFHGTAGGFSTAVAAFGVGGLIGAGVLLSIPATVDRRKLTVGFAIALAAMILIVSFNRWFWALPILLALAGAAMTVSNTAANTLLQGTADPRLLGQTVSLYMLALRGGIAIGALITGAAVDMLGVQHALLLNGALALVAQLVLARVWLRAPLSRVQAA
jgi:predicted MFS family arabinose efflux permease